MEPLHPDAASLEFLLGTWTGEGTGKYPSIAAFAYREELRFWHAGKPFLAYSQRTWAVDDARPLHTETGYWRPKADHAVELVVAHPSGHVEISEGTVAGSVIELSSRLVAGTSTAKAVTTLNRRLEWCDGVLTHSLSMAAVGLPLQPHLQARLRRIDDS